MTIKNIIITIDDKKYVYNKNAFFGVKPIWLEATDANIKKHKFVGLSVAEHVFDYIERDSLSQFNIEEKIELELELDTGREIFIRYICN